MFPRSMSPQPSTACTCPSPSTAATKWRRSRPVPNPPATPCLGTRGSIEVQLFVGSLAEGGIPVRTRDRLAPASDSAVGSVRGYSENAVSFPDRPQLVIHSLAPLHTFPSIRFTLYTRSTADRAALKRKARRRLPENTLSQLRHQ
jgi:hypothetical protein